MKILGQNAARARRGQSAFTMVEIALALGVIAFAMVAIMGVLPIGLKVQKDNKDETTLLMDGTYFLEAIRSGAKGLDDLTNYVDTITIISSNVLNRSYSLTNYSVIDPQNTNRFKATNGFQIVGLLSTPKYPAPAGNIRNIVTARVRAIAGSAATRRTKDPRLDPSELAFSYLMTSELMPIGGFPFASTNFVSQGGRGAPVDNLVRSNEWRVAANVATNLYELRLTFQWPIVPINGGKDFRLGSNKKVYRTTISGQLNRTNLYYYFFEPALYTQSTVRP